MVPIKNSLCEFSCTGRVCNIMDPLSEFSVIALTTHLSRIPHTLHTLLTYTSYISHVNLTHTLLTYTPHIHSSHTLLTPHTPHIHLTHIAHSSYTISSHTLTIMPHTHTHTGMEKKWLLCTSDLATHLTNTPVRMGR